MIKSRTVQPTINSLESVYKSRGRSKSISLKDLPDQMVIENDPIYKSLNDSISRGSVIELDVPENPDTLTLFACVILRMILMANGLSVLYSESKREEIKLNDISLNEIDNLISRMIASALRLDLTLNIDIISIAAAGSLVVFGENYGYLIIQEMESFDQKMELFKYLMGTKKIGIQGVADVIKISGKVAGANRMFDILSKQDPTVKEKIAEGFLKEYKKYLEVKEEIIKILFGKISRKYPKEAMKIIEDNMDTIVDEITQKLKCGDYKNREKVVKELLYKFHKKDGEKVFRYDAIYTVDAITKGLTEEISKLGPFCPSNPKVSILIQDAVIFSKSRGEGYENVEISQKSSKIKAVWNHKELSDRSHTFEVGKYDIVGYPYTSKDGSLKFKINGFEKKASCKEVQFEEQIIPKKLSEYGVTEKKEAQFNKKGIFNTLDLANFFPRRYEDYREPIKAKDFEKKLIAYEKGDRSKYAVIATAKQIKYGNKGFGSVVFVDEDGTSFRATYFHQDYVLENIQPGKKYILCGRYRRTEKDNRKYEAFYPEITSPDIEKYRAIIPVYSKITGMSDEYLHSSIKKVLSNIPSKDYLEEDLFNRFDIPSEKEAYQMIHFPKDFNDVKTGKRRKIFDELLTFNIGMKKVSHLARKKKAPKFDNFEIWDKIKEKLPFSLTKDQEKTLQAIRKKLEKGSKTNALVQGDVGSGKTMIAVFTLALTIGTPYQGVMLAPTDVLARQHYEEIKNLLGEFCTVEFLGGSLTSKQKKEVKEKLLNGSTKIVIGTHALVQNDVFFKNLALSIIDEQHKFGVKQREKLETLGEGIHQIMMSATPIPRTLSLSMFGDLVDIYDIKTKPAGRKEIQTKIIKSDKEVNEFMRSEIKKGRQCYVVCPFIEDAENEDFANVQSAETVTQNLTRYFESDPSVKISSISGKMSQKKVSEEIQKFANNESNILISTTIIEVGVNVPNASVMVIKSSERFGLAQLHQLRGRVGRGSNQSYCILQPFVGEERDDPKSEILTKTTDGFEIAIADLKMRGDGDYFGTSQSGENKTVQIALGNIELNKAIAEEAEKIVSEKNRFKKYAHLLDRIQG